MTDVNAQFNAHWLRQASPFINQHRGRTFVILFAGEVLDHRNALTILHDLVLLHSLGVRIVIVHGSRPQIDAALKAQGLESEFAGGRRITTKESMPWVAQAVGQERMKIEARLTSDMEASPMRGAKVRVISGNFVVARPIGVENGVDFAYSGEVRKVDKIGIKEALDLNSFVLISHIGFSRTGEMFNLASESVACEVASAIGADKLIVFSERDGLILDQQLVRHISPQSCFDVANQTPHEFETKVMLAAAKAAKTGVQRAHIVSYTKDGALLKELFTRDGSGTLITEQELEVLRAARTRDAGRLVHILNPLEKDGTLVKRPRKTLEQEMDRFIVLEKERLLIGCAALYPFSNTRGAELACLAVRPEYRCGGRGDRLLRNIEDRARANGIEQLFVLTTKTAHWFVERGFVEIPVDELPSSRDKPYNFQRNSKVFKKSLANV